MGKINHSTRVLTIVILVFFIGYFLESFREYSSLIGDYFQISTSLLPLVISFSIFAMTWHAYIKNKDNNSLFLGAVFLTIGLFDLYHMISLPFMPDFITPNSPQKSSVFWAGTRLVSSLLFFASVFVYENSFQKIMKKPILFVSVNVFSIIFLFIVLLFNNNMPIMYDQSGIKFIIWIIIFITSAIILYTCHLYMRRIIEGERNIVCLVYGFIILIFSNVVYFSYDYSGYLLRAAGYYFIYLALFKSSIEQPYEKLAEAEDNLRYAAEEKYRNLFNNANDAIILTDLKDRITSWNRSAEKMFGWLGSEVVGKELSRLFVPVRLIAERDQILQNVIDGMICSGMDTTRLHKDGTEINVSLTISPLRDAKKNIIGLSAVIRDITERKQSEEALRESEKKYATLVEKSSDGILIIQDGLMRFSNPKMADLTGFSVDEVVGRGFFDIVAPDYRDLFEKGNAANKLPERFEVNLLTRDGKEVFVEVNTSDIEYEKRPAIMYLLRDITVRKKIEKEMKKRLMKYKLDDGVLYLVKEPMPTLSFGAFMDLMKIGYDGVVISRTTEEEFKKNNEEYKYEFLWLAESGDNVLHPVLAEIQNKIEKLMQKKVILIDGLEYLIFKNGFNDTLSFIQNLREKAHLERFIVILSIDSLTTNPLEIRLLEKETREIEQADKGTLPDDQMGIIRIIYAQNSIGSKPSYSYIGHENKMSKPTVRKKIRGLVYNGYVVEVLSGRSKVLELTDKGRRLFLK